MDKNENEFSDNRSELLINLCKYDEEKKDHYKKISEFFNDLGVASYIMIKENRVFMSIFTDGAIVQEEYSIDQNSIIELFIDFLVDLDEVDIDKVLYNIKEKAMGEKEVSYWDSLLELDSKNPPVEEEANDFGNILNDPYKNNDIYEDNDDEDEY